MKRKWLIEDRSEDKVTGRLPGAVLDRHEPDPKLFERIAFHNSGLNALQVAAALMKGQRVYTNFHSYALVAA